MATNEMVAAGGNPAAMNPTPTAVSTPTNSGLFRNVGDNVGSSVYQLNSDGKSYTNYNLYDLGAATGATGSNVYSAGQQVLKDKYGIDYNSLPTQNLGDLYFNDWNNDKTMKVNQQMGQTKGDFSKLTSTNPALTTGTQMLNTTAPQVASAQQIADNTQVQAQQLAGTQGQNVTIGANGQPTSTPLAAPGTPGANPNAIPMSGGYVPTAAQPAPSILDSLKMDLINGSNSLTQMQIAQEIGKKYTAQYETLKDTPAPVTGGESRSAMGGTESQKSQTSVTQDFIQGYGALNSAEKQQYDTITTALSAPVTQQSLEDKYAQEFANTNLAAGKPGESLSQEQMKMMDINNLMKGNEDAIRAEITKAGGFATEQQVQALTSARNKVLLQQASDLQTSMNAKQDYIDHLMNFTEKDRAQVEKEVDRKLGLEQMQVGLIDKMDKAAQDNYNNIIKTNGFQGLYAALQGNPAAIQTAEKALGLPSGALAREAELEKAASAPDPKALQFVSGTANQRAGIFDPNVPGGQFTPIGGGGSSSGGTGTGGGGSASSPVLNQVINTIKGSLANPTKAQLTQIDSIASSSNPLAAIRNQAQNIMGQTAATRLFSQETAQGGLDSLSAQLKQFYANGGKTDIFSGTLVQVANKLGEVKDSKLVELATEIRTTVQAYRNAVSGTAFSEQEGYEIDTIFPGINKTEGLNMAILSGRKKIMDSLVASSYNQVLGEGVYEQLQQAYGATSKSSYAPGSVITSNGQQYKVEADGQTITPVGSKVDLSSGVNFTNSSLFNVFK